MSTDWEAEVLTLVRDGLPDLVVFDGQPSAKLEDRPEVHAILDINVPHLRDTTITSTRDSEAVHFQVRVIVRSGGSYTREDSAWAARWHSKRLRDYLVTRRLRPGGQLIDHVYQTGMVDDQAIVSHSTQIQVSQYEAKV